MCPPDIIKEKYGGESSSYTNSAESVCPIRWFTPMTGFLSAYPKAFANAKPVNNAPIRPGVFVTPIKSISLIVKEVLLRISKIIGSNLIICFLDAISGTTPPNCE